MAKQTDNTARNQLQEFLKALPQLPAVYDAKEFCNRAFTFTRVEWKEFQPSERNNYRSTSKAMIFGTELATGKEVCLETTQKGIVQPIQAMEESGIFNVNIMIVQEGKFCAIVAV